MKRKILFSFALLSLMAISVNTLHSFPGGAPSDGRTGSPGDGGKTCAQGGCHSGSVTDVSGFITSNIPAEGYTPGTSYTITVTVDQSGAKGFVVSPQKTDGTLLGTISAGTGSQVVGTKYVTHSTPKTSASAVWTFNWTAPVAGTGTVDFYGAFANNRNVVRKSKYTVTEKVANGINENGQIGRLQFYPNPVVSKNIRVSFDQKKSGELQINLIDITGKQIAELYKQNNTSGNIDEALNIPELNNGVYFLQFVSGGEVLTRRVLIQQ